jgi:hypothetical protein
MSDEESVKHQGMSGQIHKKVMKRRTARRVRREGKQLNDDARSYKKRRGYGS